MQLAFLCSFVLIVTTWIFLYEDLAHRGTNIEKIQLILTNTVFMSMNRVIARLPFVLNTVAYFHKWQKCICMRAYVSVCVCPKVYCDNASVSRFTFTHTSLILFSLSYAMIKTVITTTKLFPLRTFPQFESESCHFSHCFT